MHLEAVWGLTLIPVSWEEGGASHHLACSARVHVWVGLGWAAWGIHGCARVPYRLENHLDCTNATAYVHLACLLHAYRNTKDKKSTMALADVVVYGTRVVVGESASRGQLGGCGNTVRQQ